ncbi:MAG: ThuA domain-containing protein [Bacteroidetes bacterium]|nr:ThuA domain-containing protein [Bacteroidota bacterium]
MKRKNILQVIALILFAVTLFTSCTSNKPENLNVENARIKALIVNGQMNASHDDKESSPIIEKILELTGEFNVEVATSPAKGNDMSTFKPQFSDYDVVIIDYDGDEWPAETKTNFVDYVKNGGGVVIVHSSDNAFPNWVEYNEMIGLGGWNGRNEKSGDYVYWEKGKVVRSDTIGTGGSHGQQVPVLVQTRNLEHQIMKGLPTSWMHGQDELYGNLRGPGKNVNILATAFSDPKTNGTGKNEPVLFTIKYGEGRVFHTVLGHVNGNGPHIQMQCAGFITTLQRGAEWAATGEVTLPIPAEFPNYASWILWENFQPLTLEQLVAEIKDYELGDSREHLSALSVRIRKSDQKPKTLKMYEKAMIEILESDANDDAKKQICRELGIWGTKSAVPALEKLKLNKDCNEMAEYALERIQG